MFFKICPCLEFMPPIKLFNLDLEKPYGNIKREHPNSVFEFKFKPKFKFKHPNLVGS